jgi:hypothetical protein
MNVPSRTRKLAHQTALGNQPINPLQQHMALVASLLVPALPACLPCSKRSNTNIRPSFLIKHTYVMMWYDMIVGTRVIVVHVRMPWFHYSKTTTQPTVTVKPPLWYVISYHVHSSCHVHTPCFVIQPIDVI